MKFHKNGDEKATGKGGDQFVEWKLFLFNVYEGPFYKTFYRKYLAVRSKLGRYLLTMGEVCIKFSQLFILVFMCQPLPIHSISKLIFEDDQGFDVISGHCLERFNLFISVGFYYHHDIVPCGFSFILFIMVNFAALLKLLLIKRKCSTSINLLQSIDLIMCLLLFDIK